ncbi:hypothetical protein HMI54_012440 [Coelomomyces lativittatus]|nr:hypothetical protein HMI54_012440 [Coelomomyces lativittatus]
MTSCLFSPISSHSEPLDLALVKSSELNHPVIIENLYLRKKIPLSHLNLALVHSMNAFEVKIKTNSNEILELLHATFSKAGVNSYGLSENALLLGTFSDDQSLFVIYGLINEFKKMQLRALELCTFDQPIVCLLWQSQKNEHEDPSCRKALSDYLAQIEKSSEETQFPISFKKYPQQPGAVFY